MWGTSSHSDELTGDFGNKPEAILIADHGLSCLLAEKLSLRDLRLLQQYLPIADIAPLARSKIKKLSTEVAYLVGSTFEPDHTAHKRTRISSCQQ